MINTQVYLENIQSAMVDASWTSVDGTGTTSFIEVFTYPNWSTNGFPFLVILDNPESSHDQTTMDVAMTNNIEFHICANWATVDKQTDEGKRGEAMLRIREAYDFLREYMTDAHIESWLSTPTSAVRGSHANLVCRSEDMTVRDEPIPELNLYRRILTLPISDIINT